MPSLGRKFLMAGKSGLNLTHSEPFEQFVSRYGERRLQIESMLKNFGPKDVRRWAHGLGIETFIGTSNRVFPVGMKASPLLRAWLKRLNEAGVTFYLRHKWTGFLPDKSLRFKTPNGNIEVKAGAVVLALGGGSWKRLGSEGDWVPLLRNAGAEVEPLRPANVGFEVAWSEHFRERYEGYPIKSVVLSFGSFCQQGEFIITKEGVEGSLIYAVSALLRDEIEAKGRAVITLDLLPQRSNEWVREKLSKQRGSRSLASHLEKTVNLRGVKAGLLREFISKDVLMNMERLAHFIKNMPVALHSIRPLDEAISSAGGVKFESLDEHLMLKSMPGVFCAGEMLDWEAPTGGYLLTACFASGYIAGQGVLKWLGIANGS
jgi:uncharacterized flavoprotein (TIGR03862 family)